MYVRDNTNNFQSLSRTSTYHLNITEHAMYISLIDETLEKHGTGLQNRADLPYGYRLPSNTKVLTRISKISIAEIVLDIEAAPDASGRCLIL